MDIGKMIHDRRIQLGFTLEELGNKVGVGKSTVQKWENGFISNMKRDKIALLAAALDVNPVSFISGKLILNDDTVSNKHSAETNITMQPHYDIIRTATPEDLRTLDLYKKLDEQDKAEIRGEIKGMLKAEKYQDKASGNLTGKHEPFSGPRPAQVAAYGHRVTGVDKK